MLGAIPGNASFRVALSCITVFTLEGQHTLSMSVEGKTFAGSNNNDCTVHYFIFPFLYILTRLDGTTILLSKYHQTQANKKEIR